MSDQSSSSPSPTTTCAQILLLHRLVDETNQKLVAQVAQTDRVELDNKYLRRQLRKTTELLEKLNAQRKTQAPVIHTLEPPEDPTVHFLLRLTGMQTSEEAVQEVFRMKKELGSLKDLKKLKQQLLDFAIEDERTSRRADGRLDVTEQNPVTSIYQGRPSAIGATDSWPVNSGERIDLNEFELIRKFVENQKIRRVPPATVAELLTSFAEAQPSELDAAIVSLVQTLNVRTVQEIPCALNGVGRKILEAKMLWKAVTDFMVLDARKVTVDKVVDMLANKAGRLGLKFEVFFCFACEFHVGECVSFTPLSVVNHNQTAGSKLPNSTES
jgi:hypothetical protein